MPVERGFGQTERLGKLGQSPVATGKLAQEAQPGLIGQRSVRGSKISLRLARSEAWPA